MKSEQDFVSFLEKLKSYDRNIIKGIGDDCSIIRFDKNKKYVCGLIYDVGDSNQYLRNPMVEQFLNTVYQNTDNIDN